MNLSTAMSTALPAAQSTYGIIAAKLCAKIDLSAAPCLTVGSGVMVQTATSARYPDVLVTCDERDRVPDGIVVRYPKLIVEVLSESTAKDDLGPKMRE